MKTIASLLLITVFYSTAYTQQKGDKKHGDKKAKQSENINTGKDTLSVKKTVTPINYILASEKRSGVHVNSIMIY